MPTPITVPGPKADIPVYVFPVKGAPNAPAVVVYMDVFGPRAELFDMCRAFAERGVAAVLPNLFNRLGSPVFAPVNGHGAVVPAAVLHANDVTSMDMSVADTAAILDSLNAGNLPIAPQRICAIGYCMGGRNALAATARLAQVEAGISAHGGRLVTEEDTSPHRMIARLNKPFQFYHATDDDSCSDEDQWLIGEAALNAGPHVTSQRLAAFHGWSFAKRWSYDATASALVLDEAVSLFTAS